MSGFTLNAAKWASSAKENVVKISSTAVQQASDLTKDSNLLGSLQSGVSNVSSKVTDVGSKAWSNINSFWSTSFSGEGSHEGTSSLNGTFSNFNILGNRSGYDSMSGETLNSNNNNNYSSYNNVTGVNEISTGKQQHSASSSSLSRNQPKKDDWNWESDEWENDRPKSTSEVNRKKKPTTTASSIKKTDLINFDDDNWETVDAPILNPSKSKN